MGLTFFYKTKFNKKNETVNVIVLDSIQGFQIEVLFDDYYLLDSRWYDAFINQLTQRVGYKNFDIDFKHIK